MQEQQLLTINAGSSSLKFAVYRMGAAGPVAGLRGQIAGIGQGGTKLDLIPGDQATPAWPFDPAAIDSHQSALRLLIDRLGLRDQPQEWLGIGHRIVHGGTIFTHPVVLTEPDIAALEGLTALAPLHQPHNVGAIKALRAMLPRMPQVGCFDTAFHAGNPERVTRFALPEKYWRQGIRRYGFHGLSYEAILARLQREKMTIPPRLVIAHLGNGASLAAIREGAGLATTMGFSTLDGLVMGTRPGIIDPGVLLHLLHQGMNAAELEALLYRDSGLLGLSGFSADMKTVSHSDLPQAKLAIDIYCHRVAVELGRLAAELQGLDMLIFTGGVGENADEIRARIAGEAGWLGITLDETANAKARQVTRIETISRPGSLPVLVIPTDEEGVIARHCLKLLHSGTRA
ncbi:MAG TPA: acetate/propionate family kinase [Dongiaceae bacterium]|nr:acetate/propionate family kinase [Dongiaceae bacterium]